MTAFPWPERLVSEVAAKDPNALATGPFGSSISSRFFRSSGVPVIRGGNLSADPEVRLVDKGLVFLTPEKAGEFSRSVVRQGDLVFTCWGSINQVGMIDDTATYGAYVISNKQMKVTPDPAIALPEYLYYHFSGPQKQREILEGSIGTSIPGFNLARLRSMTVPLPALPEQAAIVQALSEADKLAGALNKAIAKKQSIKQGLMQALLTGHTRLPGFSRPWLDVAVGEVATGGRGAGLSKSSLSHSASTPCLLYGELFTTYDRVISSVVSRTNELGTVRSAGGEVLLPGSTTTSAEDLASASALLQSGVLVGSDVNILRPNRRRVDPVWLAYFLTSQRRTEIAERAQGITIVHLYARSLLSLMLTLPPLAEQTAIASLLCDADNELAALERRLRTTRQVKHGMMQELLTGRSRLVQTDASV